jgi:hypothetical protein
LSLLAGRNKGPVVLLGIAVVLDLFLAPLLEESLHGAHLEVGVRAELYHLLLLLVIDKHEHIEAAQTANLDSFL